MKYIRQLLFKCKNTEDLKSLYYEIQNLIQIEYIQKSIIMKCINQDKYDYIDNKYDCSVLLYFTSENDIEKYCVHPIHTNFAKTMLQKVNVTVLDYSINE